MIEKVHKEEKELNQSDTQLQKSLKRKKNKKLTMFKTIENYQIKNKNYMLYEIKNF